MVTDPYWVTPLQYFFKWAYRQVQMWQLKQQFHFWVFISRRSCKFRTSHSFLFSVCFCFRIWCVLLNKRRAEMWKCSRSQSNFVFWKKFMKNTFIGQPRKIIAIRFLRISCQSNCCQTQFRKGIFLTHVPYVVLNSVVVSHYKCDRQYFQ